MKKLIVALLVGSLLAIPLFPDVLLGKQITVTAGTAIRVTTGNLMASSILIQMKHGGSGVGYVLYADPSATCNVGAAGTTLVAELAPANPLAPGGSFTYPSNNDSTTQQGGFSPAYFCVDGSNSGDVIIVSWSQR